LTRNPLYVSGPVPIETWTLKFYPDISALRAAFVAKQIDVMAAGPRDYAAVKNLSGAALLSSPSPEFIGLLFNTDNVALNDVRVRQALSYALDRNVLLDDIEKQGVLIDATVLPGFWANTRQMSRFTFDVTRARQLLAEAGWRDPGDGVLRKDGRPLTLDLWTEADHPLLEPLAFRIREMYAALGIQVQLQLDDRPGWITHAFDHRFDLLLLSRKLPLDPDQRWYWQSDQNAKGSGFNFGSYASARTDALYRELQRVGSCDPAGRATMFNEVEQNLLVDSPAVFLFVPQKYLVLQGRVLGPAPSLFAGDFWNLQDWHVKP
jgi:peptide/nickel transport system substrate-binding protein